MKKICVLFVIFDGWGYGLDLKVSVIVQGNMLFVDSFYDQYFNVELMIFGEQVGLLEGQMGNFEVGYFNIGVGWIVYQEFVCINKVICDGELQ